MRPYAISSCSRLLHWLRQEDSPNVAALNELAMLVERSRRLFGHEEVDEAIKGKQDEHDAVEAGLCLICRTKKAVGEDLACAECGAQLDAETAEFMSQSGN